MKLIAEKLGKTDKLDRLRYLRADASSVATTMPRQGTLPHDLIHYVVEQGLGLGKGFTGMIARGADPTFAMAGAEADQVEAIVEALQTQLWSGQFDAADFLEGVRFACAARERPSVDFADGTAGQRLFDAALALDAQWRAIPFHGALTLEFTV